MSSSLQVVPLTLDLHDRWDAFVEASDDGWFAQTTSWMDFCRAIRSQQFVDNLSFFITRDSEIYGLCPVVLEMGEGRRVLACMGEPIPFPVFSPAGGRRLRQACLELYVETLEQIAHKHDAAYVSVRVPALTPSYLNSRLPMANPLLKFGYCDLAFLSQVVDLRDDEAALWANVRKGHRADIRRAARVCKVRVWDAGSVTREKFGEYQRLHFKHFGRVTRSQTTFDMMFAWIQRGHAVLVEAHRDGVAIAFTLIIVFRRGAFYASACEDPDHHDVPAMHLIQWESFLWLKAQDIQFYDLGLQRFGRQWFDIPTPKDVNISRFKRGFGGATVPLLTAERYFADDYLAAAFRTRAESYLSALGSGRP